MADWKRFVDAEVYSHLLTRLGDAKVFIAVDTSGSTDACSTPVYRAEQLYWDTDLGGTSPATIFKEGQTLQRLLSSDFWCLFTDGEVDDDEVRRLHNAAKRYGALPIPVIILITGCKPVNETNLSVGMALYVNVVDVVFLYKRIGTTRRRTCIYVLHAKGCFAPLPSADFCYHDNAPQFSSESAFWEVCATKAIKVVRAENRSKETPGILIDTVTNAAGHTLNVTVDIQKLVITPVIAQHDLDTVLNPRVLNDVALAARTQGSLSVIKTFLDKQRLRNVVIEAKDIYQAGAVVSQAVALLKSPETEQKNELGKTVHEKHQWNRTIYRQKASEQAKEALQEVVSRNGAIDTALDHLTAMEHSGYCVGIFDLQPSRSQISAYAHPSNIHVALLDFTSARYAMQCILCCEEEAMMSLAVKQLDDETIRTNYSQIAPQSLILYGKRTADKKPFSS
ncbi:hypothetical protein BKA63DRAFT_562890 [Paraphoma chrysanthemicola]|nr:hypothetical protein BKA63DRAFT_562890 [Paraphoma chrysanthemicola]